MSKNSIGWGDIYASSHWGIGVVTNTISWGIKQREEANSGDFEARVLADGGIVESITCTF